MIDSKVNIAGIVVEFDSATGINFGPPFDPTRQEIRKTETGWTAAVPSKGILVAHEDVQKAVSKCNVELIGKIYTEMMNAAIDKPNKPAPEPQAEAQAAPSEASPS